MDPKTRLSTRPPRPEKTKKRRKGKKQSKKRPTASQVRRQKAREPQVVEGAKQAMFIRATSSGLTTTSLLRDLVRVHCWLNVALDRTTSLIG
jgi:hypothetical protein